MTSQLDVRQLRCLVEFARWRHRRDEVCCQWLPCLNHSKVRLMRSFKTFSILYTNVSAVLIELGEVLRGGRPTRATRCFTPSRPSCCTQSWMLVVIDRWRSSVDCWQHLCTSVVRNRPTNVVCLSHLATVDVRTVVKFCKSRVWNKVPDGSTQIFGDPLTCYNTHRRVTDRIHVSWLFLRATAYML